MASFSKHSGKSAFWTLATRCCLNRSQLRSSEIGVRKKEEIMTINVLRDHMMRTVFFSLAAAIIVFIAMLLLTTV
jgi:hypothetical protein